MKRLNLSKFFGVTFLTPVVALLTACSYIHNQYGETCNYRAYTQNELSEFLSKRFHSNAPVRMAIIPFSTPANLTVPRNTAGLNNDLAWKVHAEFLTRNKIPIVEVFNREDWPGKREEFFTGNFGAISTSREAGYDLVMVGYLENTSSLDTMAAYTKLIEVESGITVWYGKTVASTSRPLLQTIESRMWLDNTRPDLLYTEPLIEELAHCIVEGIAHEEEPSWWERNFG